MINNLVYFGKTSDKNLINSLSQGLDLKVPNVFLISNETEEKQLNIIKTVLNNCCDGSRLSVDSDENKTVHTKTMTNGKTFTFVEVNNKQYQNSDLIKFAVEMFKDTGENVSLVETGFILSTEYLSKIEKEMSDDNIGVVYSSYIEDGHKVYVPSFTAYSHFQVSPKNVTFRSKVLRGTEKNIFDIIVSGIKHSIVTTITGYNLLV